MCVTTEEDLFALSEIEELKAALPNLKVDICIWKPSESWDGFAGSPVDAFKKDLVNDMAQGLKPEVYLCGPPGLVDATQAVAEEMGLPHENIFGERFLPG